MRLLIVLSSVVALGWSHTISKDIKEYIARGCYDDGALKDLDDAIGAALKESGGSPLNFNFLITEDPNSNLMAYPVAVVSAPEKLELLVKKGGAQLEWLNGTGYGEKIVQYPAMHKAISSMNLRMFETVLDLAGTMRPCNAHINLVYELCQQIVRFAYPDMPRQPIELLESALKRTENLALLEDTTNQYGLTCMGYVFRFGAEGAKETKMHLLDLMLEVGASPFAKQRDESTPLETIFAWSNSDLIIDALTAIFMEHPENDPFHPAVDRALLLVDDSAEVGAAIAEARIERRNAVLRAMMLPEISEVLQSDQLRDPLAALISPYLIQLCLANTPSI